MNRVDSTNPTPTILTPDIPVANSPASIIPETTARPEGRLLSLDVFRGLIMFLLVAEGALVYDALLDAAPDGTIFHNLVTQFTHHPWYGLRFWDLVQPFFMFIVGVAMTYSISKRLERGASWSDLWNHILYRCVALFFLGVILHIGYAEELVWELWNVLTQLSFTILVAFAIFRLPFRRQLLISFGLLLLSEILYRSFSVAGFNEPFVQGKNFGAWMDLVFMGKINPEGWVVINALPTAAHTIWGVLAGKLLMSQESDQKKLRQLAIVGLVGLFVGYGLDLTGVTPIIKRICTSSFVIVSGGWCLLALALFYWLLDVRGLKRWTSIFVIVGMNPIFIYMFSETIGKQWLYEFVAIFTGGALTSIGGSVSLIEVITALTVFAIECALCVWLYRRRIFIKI